MKSLQSFRAAGNHGRPLHLSRWRFRVNNSFRPSICGFHATSRRPVLGGCLIQTHSLIESLHHVTGLPWAATIPMTAVLVSCVSVSFKMYSSTILLRTRKLAPQLLEQRSLLLRQVSEKHASKSALEKQSILDKLFLRFCSEARTKNHCQTWKTYFGLFRFPVWYLIMETLRQMTGTQEGFLRLAGSSLTGHQNPDSSFMDSSVVSLEPTLATEGALWFHNLLLPDPNLILPFVLSGVLFLGPKTGCHRIFTPVLGQRPLSSPLVWYNRNALRIIKVFSLAAGPLTLHFPSAMLLYWISSSLLNTGIEHILRRWHRVRPAAAIKIFPARKQQYRGPSMEDMRATKKGKR
jgi:inner membrane protein COX18